MSFVAGAIALGVGTAAVGAYSADRAADAQSEATERGAKLTANQYAQSRSDLSDWVGTGRSANARLSELLGIGSGVDENDPAYRALVDQKIAAFDAAHRAKYGIGLYDQGVDQGSRDAEIAKYKRAAADEILKTRGGARSESFGTLLKPFTGADLASEPGYQFGLAEGEKALQRQGSRAGMRLSPATMKALLRFNEDYAGTKFNDAFNRDAANKNSTYGMLSGTSNTGANSAGMVAGLGANATNNISNMIQSGANANAAGTVGVGNAITQGATGAFNTVQNQYWLNQFLNQPRDVSPPFG